MNICREDYSENSDFLRKRVVEYNLSKLPDTIKHPVNKICFTARDDNDQIIGGITAVMFWHHLQIESLWVDETIRGCGCGSGLLQKIEECALEYKCSHIQLDTFSFQAPEFYRKHGYEIAGVIKEHTIKESSQYILVKRLRREKDGLFY
ncbi:GNAT family N-acetyltransferase [Niallia taxi]|uniref:GNAT family N-acetyltransferase n=1 Tax=Niallia taxi TaxID=2499688 RepID=UPI002934C620|nr:GNAT family N-acetyltransferase [Niallia taxi]WOD61982.1 GNAT family N-acetyltransferase [Niallia taxi]